MPKKVLFCATIGQHFHHFHLPYLQWFKEQGWEVHAAANGGLDLLPYADRTFALPISRSPWGWSNRKAYGELKRILAENQYDIVHCHTPMGGVLARLAAREARKNGTKVIYTAHGFHFCKGAPLLNWLIYYPIEKYLAGMTDCLIAINEEDYGLAREKRFKAGRIERVHGVGVNTERFRPIDESSKRGLRLKAGLGSDDFLLFNVAEFNANKNQQLLIRALALIGNEMPNAKLLLAGQGPRMEACRKLAERLGVADKVLFLGYRNDIHELLPLCDVAVASSLREGLPVNVMEAMACGLPVVATHNRGHSELIKDSVNGFVIKDQDIRDFADALLELGRSPYLRRKMAMHNLTRVTPYSLSMVSTELSGLYRNYMSEDENEPESQYRRAYL